MDARADRRTARKQNASGTVLTMTEACALMYSKGLIRPRRLAVTLTFDILASKFNQFTFVSS